MREAGGRRGLGARMHRVDAVARGRARRRSEPLVLRLGLLVIRGALRLHPLPLGAPARHAVRVRLPSGRRVLGGVLLCHERAEGARGGWRLIPPRGGVRRGGARVRGEGVVRRGQLGRALGVGGLAAALLVRVRVRG